MKPTHIWNSYRDSEQRGLVILSLSVVASLHSLNTKCDYDCSVPEIKSADAVLHKHGISATSWITLLYTCAREVQTQEDHSLHQAWGPVRSWRKMSYSSLCPHEPASTMSGCWPKGTWNDWRWHMRQTPGTLPPGKDKMHYPKFHPCHHSLDFWIHPSWYLFLSLKTGVSN